MHSGHAVNRNIALSLPEHLKHPNVEQGTNVEALMCAGYGEDLKEKGVWGVVEDVLMDGDK